MPANHPAEVVLDECLDRMFEGSEWVSLVSLEGELREVIDLMEVEELLRLVAARTPKMAEPRRMHVLGKLRDWIAQTVHLRGGEEVGMEVAKAASRP